MLPFTREQFMSVFAEYNAAVWPAQIAAYALGIGLVFAVLRPSRGRSRFAAAVLGLMWVWTGLAYHGLFFAAINKAALGFAALFVIQGVLLIYAGGCRGRLAFGPPSGTSAWLGWALVAYAAVVYLLLGTWVGHRYPALPMFGITPCPVTLFTFGMLLLTREPVPGGLLVIPLLWSLVGGSAAFLLGVPQDWPLLISGLSVLLLMLRDRQRLTTAQP